jgi:hypothetical protein
MMTGHCLRVLIINKLKVNSVSGLEIAQAVRHSSINSQGNYNRETTAETQVNKQLALRPTIGNNKNSNVGPSKSLPPPFPRHANAMVPYIPPTAAVPGSDAAMEMEMAKQRAKIQELEMQLAAKKMKKKKKKRNVSFAPPPFYTGYPPPQQQYPAPTMYPPHPYGGGYPPMMPFHNGGGYNPFAGFPPQPAHFATGFPPQPPQQYDSDDDESSTSSAPIQQHYQYYYPPQNH